MTDQQLIDTMLAEVRAAREQQDYAEARRLAEAEQQRRAEAERQRQSRLEDAITQHAAIRHDVDQAVEAMIAMFGAEVVSYPKLTDALDDTNEMFNRHLSFVSRAVGEHMATYQGTDSNLEATRAFTRFANPVSPSNALIAWCAKSPDDATRRWRVGLLATFYPNVFGINPAYPNADFDPQAATDRAVYQMRFGRMR